MVACFKYAVSFKQSSKLTARSYNNVIAGTEKLVYPLYLQELADNETEIVTPEEVAAVRSKRDGDDSEDEHKDFTATLQAVSA